MCASRSTNQRKPTPCTRPRTRKRRAWVEDFSAEAIFRLKKAQIAEARTLGSTHICNLTSDLLRPRQICSLGRVYLNLLAFVDEGRHLHDQARLSLRRLGHARCGCAFQPGLNFQYG